MDHTLPLLEAEKLQLSEVRKFFLYLLLSVPFSFVWKLFFQPNMSKVMMFLSCSSIPLPQKCILFQLYLKFGAKSSIDGRTYSSS